MSTGRSVRICVGRLPQTDLGDFWELGLTVQDPSVPNLPLETPATGEVTGTLAVTLAGATLAGTGTVAVSGTLAQTLGGVTLVGTGTVTGGGVTGTLAVTLGGATLAGTGAVPVSGALAVTLDGVALAATGAVGVVGAASVTLDGATVAGAGAVSVAGSFAIALDDAALSATGEVLLGPVDGTLAITLDAVALAGVGTVVTPPPPRPLVISPDMAWAGRVVIDPGITQRFLDQQAKRMRVEIKLKQQLIRDAQEQQKSIEEKERQQRVEWANLPRPRTGDLDYELERLKEEERAVARMQNKQRLAAGRKKLEEKRKRRK